MSRSSERTMTKMVECMGTTRIEAVPYLRQSSSRIPISTETRNRITEISMLKNDAEQQKLLIVKSERLLHSSWRVFTRLCDIPPLARINEGILPFGGFVGTRQLREIALKRA